MTQNFTKGLADELCAMDPYRPWYETEEIVRGQDFDKAFRHFGRTETENLDAGVLAEVWTGETFGRTGMGCNNVTIRIPIRLECGRYAGSKLDFDIIVQTEWTDPISLEDDHGGNADRLVDQVVSEWEECEPYNAGMMKMQLPRFKDFVSSLVHQAIRDANDFVEGACDQILDVTNVFSNGEHEYTTRRRNSRAHVLE